MKNLLPILLLLIFSYSSFGQNGKYTEKLSELYYAEKYEKVKKYKNSKLKSLSAKSLFYKSMSYFMTKDDQNALKLMNLAIDKGPTDQDMYFYRGVIYYYSEDYSKALINLDQAIIMLPDVPDYYYLKATIFSTVKKQDSAAYYYKKTLTLQNPDDEGYLNTSYNLGLSLQQTNQNKKAEEVFKTHHLLFPEDYYALAKLIQMYNINGKTELASELKIKMHEAYKKNELTSTLKNMFCIDQIKWNNTKVLTFESYGKQDDEVIHWNHKFLIQDENGDIDYKIQTEKDTTDSTSVRYIICKVKDDVHYSYNHFYETDSTTHEALKLAVLEVLDNKVKPETELKEYNKWLDQKYTELNSLTNLEKDGSSAEKAILVNSISEEYQWIRKYYPTYSVTKQRLVNINNVPYDVLTIKNSKKETIDVYFDISKFFGKW